MDDLQAYVMTGAGKDRDIIKKMRVILETYCRSTYPGSFAPTDRLGGMVEKIKKGGDKHPAWAAMDELEQINEYSRDHHHGEDPDDGSPDLIDAPELAGFVQRLAYPPSFVALHHPIWPPLVACHSKKPSTGMIQRRLR